jgi:flagellar biosynthetic protein FliP
MFPLLFLWVLPALAQDPVQIPALPPDPGSTVITGMATGLADAPVSTAVRLLLTLTALSFLPAMLVVMTPFVRFVVVFSMLRQALGLAQSPPNQVIVGLSLFLSLLVMEPTLQSAYDRGLEPFLAGELQPLDAWDQAIEPVRGFMLANTRKTDMETILQVANQTRPETLSELSTPLVTSAFVLSELKTALIITVYVFIPFLVIDLVTTSVLLGMGMMMLPPMTISLPFKIMIFVLIDGWGLLVRDMVQGIAR